MMSRVDRLGAGDLMTLWAEAPTTPMHIGLAGLLDPGPLLDGQGQLRLDELRVAVAARLARAPELCRRIRWTRFWQGRPAVVDDHRFAIARHLTAAHLAGCDEEAFWNWCANQALAPMDRDHPLWQIVFATGLDAGRVGVLVIMHHALADGIAGAALAVRLLDPAPDAIVAPRPWRPAPPPGPMALTADAVVARIAAVAAGLRRLPRVPDAVRLAARYAAARAAVAQPAPATSLARPIGAGRRLAVIHRPPPAGQGGRPAARRHRQRRGAGRRGYWPAPPAGRTGRPRRRAGATGVGPGRRCRRGPQRRRVHPHGPPPAHRRPRPRGPAGPHRRHHPGRQGRP
jgi:diacylglycerol O-acyltransferase